MLSAAPPAFCQVAAPKIGAPVVFPRQALDNALAAGRAFLLRQIGPDGLCAGETAPTHIEFGGQTALCLYALLSSDVDPKDPTVVRAAAWLVKQKLTGTYAVAMRACALSALAPITKDPAQVAALKADMEWLIAAADREGGYTYTSSHGMPRTVYDNSNSQVALLGIHTGADALGMSIPNDFLKRVEQHWLTQQQANGGWGYRVLGGEVRSKTYGSMTAAGLATLYICDDHLRREQFIRGLTGSQHRGMSHAWQWLEANCDLTQNPGNGVEKYYYWLYSLHRVGVSSGQKYIAGKDWYLHGVNELLPRQNSDGSWERGSLGETCFAMIFLSHGRHPVLLNKLDYGGKWNPRPNDAANFAQWMSYTFERQVTWQAIKLQSAAADLQDAPIVYISGNGPFDLSPRQIDALRQYVYQGGTIVSEAACNNADFTLDMQKLYKKLFPQFTASRLPADHPLYSLNFQAGKDSGIIGVSNGIRLLAVHCPKELSASLQIGPTDGNRSSFETLANICLYVTDRGMLRQRGQEAWPAPATFTPRASLAIARIKHDGLCDPEPLAWQRLAALVGASQQIKLEVSEPMECINLDASKWPLAVMSGTKAFTFSQADAAALTRYLNDGGLLFVEAAGGSKEFAACVEKDILPLVGDSSGLLTAEHPIYQGPCPIKINYRRQYALSLGPSAHEGHLRGIEIGNRLAIVYSSDDLTAGMAGYSCYGLQGYNGETAVALMTNIIAYAASR